MKSNSRPIKLGAALNELENKINLQRQIRENLQQAVEKGLITQEEMEQELSNYLMLWLPLEKQLEQSKLTAEKGIRFQIKQTPSEP